MELKHLKPEHRLIFLKKFTQELMISTLEEEKIKKKIEVEKIKRKFLEPSITPEQAFKKIIKTSVIPKNPKFNKTIFYPAESPALKSFKLEIHQKPEGFNLGKIENLLKDPLINMIECQGSEKEVTVKKNSRIYQTKITLNQQEIAEILNLFSQYARIPILKGIFKAVVGNLMISALISDIIGSKFIITRISSG